MRVGRRNRKWSVVGKMSSGFNYRIECCVPDDIMGYCAATSVEALEKNG